jgi:hypothetical protein
MKKASGEYVRKARGVLLLGVAPSVHSVVEVDHSEREAHHLEVAVDLVGKPRISAARRSREEVYVGGPFQ